MSEFLSLTDTGPGQEKVNGKASVNGDDSQDSEEEIDEKEVEEQVGDLADIRNKEMLKRNLRVVIRENMKLKAKVKRLEEKLKSSDESTQSYNMLFRIDLDGDDEEEQEVPVGEAHLILSNSQEEEVVEEKKSTNFSNKCFNCLGDHRINDCPEPKDFKAIAKNRREHQSKNVTSVRYHVDERFGHLRPGLPSDRLRSALRLDKDQVPEYIYRMRVLGYPPGWLKAAEINSSGLNLYHEKGKKLGEVGDEDGEIIDDGDKVKYNMDRLIDWPGFNSPLPKEFTDETRKYRAISYSAVKTLKQMREELRPKEQKGYVRGTMQDTSVSATNDTDEVELITLDSSQDEDVDMEQQKEEDGQVESDAEKDELEETAESEIEGGVGSARNGKMMSTPLRKQQSSESSSLDASSLATPSRQSSQSSSTSSISKTETGTPICELYSPFTRLPNQVNFGKDMTEHIVFDNLPDYTGKWDQMKGLISRIRTKRRKICDEEKD